MAYNGSTNSDKLFYNVANLQTQQRYAFYVHSVNFNGLSQGSPELNIIVCLPPANFERPHYISSTRNSVKIGWTKPKELGGCPLVTYKIFLRKDSETTY